MMTDKQRLALFWRIVKEIDALHKHKSNVKKIFLYEKNEHHGSGFWDNDKEIMGIKRGRIEFQIGVCCHETTHAILFNQFEKQYARRLEKVKGHKAREKVAHDSRFKKMCWDMMNHVSKHIDVRWRDK